MKKTFIYSTLFLAVISCTKEKAISEYTTNSELIAAKNSINPEQKKDYYLQFAKNQLVEDMEKTFSYKNYSKEVLKTFADSILSYRYAEDIDELKEVETIKNLDNYLGNKSKQEEFNKHKISLLGSYPNVAKKENENVNTAIEVIPGEIFKIFFNAGGKATSEIYYKIVDDKLENLDIFPKNDDDAFYDIVFAKMKGDEFSLSDGEGRTNSMITDLKNGFYFINTSFYHPLIEDGKSYKMENSLEYKTKDFKTFIPVRFKTLEENAKWINF